MNACARYCYSLATVVLLSACGDPNQRLDEYVFYDGPQFKLKVVRYYRNIPFSYLGEHAVVMCRSDSTADLPAHKQQDAGWRMLGTAAAKGSHSAQEVAATARENYTVLDDHTLLVKINIFSLSADACGHFISWDPSRLPQSMIDSVPKPDYCAPVGQADCRYYDFEGERAPRYAQIRVRDKGKVSFTVSSPAFKGVEVLRVRTRNNGGLWHVETLSMNSDKPGLEPDKVQSLSVALLEKGGDDISLGKWFESTLPPGSMVIWPDALGACSDQHNADGQPSDRQCAAIQFTDRQGNSGTLSIAMQTVSGNRPEKVSFYSGEYNSNDTSYPLKSLTALRERLTRGTN